MHSMGSGVGTGGRLWYQSESCLPGVMDYDVPTSRRADPGGAASASAASKATRTRKAHFMLSLAEVGARKCRGWKQWGSAEAVVVDL